MKRVFVFFILLLFSISLYSSTFAKSPPKLAEIKLHTNGSDSDEVEAVKKFVDAFYLKFLSYGKKGIIINTENTQELKRFPELDSSYITKIGTMHKRARKAEPQADADIDPILWAQDFPKKIKTKSVIVDADAAMATVQQIWNADDIMPICVSLKKRGDSWKIIDILDPEMLEKEDCSSWNPGAVFPDLKF